MFLVAAVVTLVVRYWPNCCCRPAAPPRTRRRPENAADREGSASLVSSRTATLAPHLEGPPVMTAALIVLPILVAALIDVALAVLKRAAG